MKTSLFKIGLAGLLAAAIAAVPMQVRAQDSQKPATEKKEAKAKHRVLPFHGKLKAVDTTAKTISVGKRTFHITSKTRIFKAEKPATLEDGVVGEVVSGGFTEDADGKLMATKVTFGPKAKGESKKKKAKKSDTEGSDSGM